LLIYRPDYDESAFELFIRATSKEFFKNTFGQIGITKDNFSELKTYFEADPLRLGMWHHVSVPKLINTDKIATSE
jgi:hypothetical protein